MAQVNVDQSSEPLLQVEDVRFSYHPREEFLGPVTLDIRPGQCWGIVGPNGAGKTTLLRILAGLIRPDQGQVRLAGADLYETSTRRRAQLIAYVPQSLPSDTHQLVRDTVLLGRYPHRTMSLFESPSDHRIAESAMRTTATLPFADRSLSTLSGGEAQRVHLAAALAQEPRLMLLDEPTGSLDVRQQLVIFDILRRRAVEDGVAVMVVTHDINLAARYCSDMLLLSHGKVAAIGSPEVVVRPEVLEPVCGVKMTVLERDDLGLRWVVPIEPSGEDAP